MQCPIMVQLVKKLDSVRAEQNDRALNLDEAVKKRRLRSIETFLDYHERTCAICQKLNPSGTQFVENSISRR
jgi:hypothetical protein